MIDLLTFTSPVLMNVKRLWEAIHNAMPEDPEATEPTGPWPETELTADERSWLEERRLQVLGGHGVEARRGGA